MTQKGERNGGLLNEGTKGKDGGCPRQPRGVIYFTWGEVDYIDDTSWWWCRCSEVDWGSEFVVVQLQLRCEKRGSDFGEFAGVWEGDSSFGRKMLEVTGWFKKTPRAQKLQLWSCSRWSVGGGGDGGGVWESLQNVKSLLRILFIFTQSLQWKTVSFSWLRLYLTSFQFIPLLINLFMFLSHQTGKSQKLNQA